MTNNIDGIDRTDHRNTITVDAFDIQSALGLIDGVLATAPLTVEHRDDLGRHGNSACVDERSA
jgi:hypothetical protein